MVTGTGTLAADLLGLMGSGDKASVQFTLPIRQFVMCFKAFLNGICGLVGRIMLMMGRWEVTRRGDAAQIIPSRHCITIITVVQLTCHLVLMLWLFRLQVSVKIGISIILDAIFHKLHHVL